METGLPGITEEGEGEIRRREIKEIKSITGMIEELWIGESGGG
jgi:hypothetical protein